MAENQSTSAPLFRADLHVHSRHSGTAKHLRTLQCLDSYSSPLAVYRRARSRGMNLVTITDHDSIDGCLELLDQLPGDDIIIGEEVTAYVPELHHNVHVGVYDITEAHHKEVQSLRGNLVELVGYLRAQNILYALNHLFHDFTRDDKLVDYITLMFNLFDNFEEQNGSMQRIHNQFITRLLRQMESQGKKLGRIGGSDSHTLRRIGRTYTASTATNKQEFLADIRAGRSFVTGRHCNQLQLAGDIYGVVLGYYPYILQWRSGDFSLVARMKNIALSLGLIPFLFIPYLAALRHSRSEIQRLEQFTKLFFDGPAAPLADTPSE